MSRYRLTAEAQRDLQEIRDYLTAEAGPRVARYVVSALIVALRKLGKDPGMGHRREDLTPQENVLFWPVFSYLIVYQRDAKPIGVVAVLHGKRDVAAALAKRWR